MAWSRNALTTLATAGATFAFAFVVSCNGAEFSTAGGSAPEAGNAGTGGSASSGGNKATAGSGGAGNQAGKTGGGGSPGGGQATGGQTNPGGAGEPGAAGSGGGGTIEPGFQPPTEGLVYWFSADFGVMLDGSTVTGWKNRATTGLNATQVLEGARPSLSMLETPGLPIVTFDGQDDFLELPELDQAWSAGLSVFVVARSDMTTPCSAFIELSNGSELDDINFAAHGNAIQYEIDQSLLTAQDGTLPVGELRVLEAHQSGGGMDQTPVELRVNGGQAGSTVMPLPKETTRVSNFLGRSLYLNCVPYSGGIAELLLFARKVSADERTAIELYLLEKWLP